MPAYTVAQLHTVLGNYVEPGGSFSVALAQVLPRLYAMGLWRDLTFEATLDGAPGYFSLPLEADSLLAVLVNDYPRPARSLWQDLRIVGRQTTLPPVFGAVDDGYHPVLLDMKDVQDVDTEDDVVAVTGNQLVARIAGTTSAMTSAAFSGDVLITVQGTGNEIFTLTQNQSGANLLFTAASPFNKILSVNYDGVTAAIDLIDSAFTGKIIASIPIGSGVLRHRRFRIKAADNGDTNVHILCKRFCPQLFDDQTVVHLGHINAIKHALLGRIAEDNADLERANYHWGVCEKLLDEDLGSHFGLAKPTIRLALNSGAATPLHNMY